MKPWFAAVAVLVLGVCCVVFVAPAARHETPTKDRQPTDISAQLREQLTLDGCVSAMRTDCIELLEDVRAAKAPAVSNSQASASQGWPRIEAKNSAQ